MKKAELSPIRENPCTLGLYIYIYINDSGICLQTDIARIHINKPVQFFWEIFGD